MAAPKLKTNAELCVEVATLPEHVSGEVIDGAIYAMARPSPAHANALTEILGALRFGGGGGGGPVAGWYIQPEVEIRFRTDELVVPDVSGWRSERITGHRNDNPITVTPDWICEILSDSTRRKDLGPKRDLYRRQQVEHLWLVDPHARTLEVFSLGPRWELVGTWSDAASVDAPPFEGVVLNLARWWLEAA